jgi:glycerol-3-phosphate acyltransferase PlsX
MGGDGGVAVTVKGAVAAARELNLSVILVGVEDEIGRELSRLDTRKVDIRIRHAPEVVEMRESPAVALRKKKDSSIRVGVDLVKEGEAGWWRCVSPLQWHSGKRRIRQSGWGLTSSRRGKPRLS